MQKALSLYQSSIGKKAVMAITGVVGYGFVIAHMIGNLQTFLGADVLNAYAATLRKMPALLYGARLILVSAVILHVIAAIQLTRMSRRGRPVDYDSRDYVEAKYASRTMRWSGPILLLFVIYHLMHFTFGNVHPNFVHGDVYGNLVSGFRVWYVSAFYIAAMIALGLHLYHGVWSMFQSLGFNTPKHNKLLRAIATFSAIVLTVGNISLPLAVLAGWIS